MNKNKNIELLKILVIVIISMVGYNIVFNHSFIYFITLITGGGERFIELSEEQNLSMVNDAFAEFDLLFEPDSFNPGKAILVIREEKIPYTEILIDDFSKMEIDYGPAQKNSSDLLFSSLDQKITVIIHRSYYYDEDTENETISLEQLGITVDYGNIVERDSEEPIKHVIFIYENSIISPNKEYDNERLTELYQNRYNFLKQIINEMSLYVELR